MKKDDFAVRDPTLSVFQSAVTNLTQRSVRPPAEKAALIEAARSIVNQRIAGSNESAPTSNFSASVAQIGEPQSCVALVWGHQHNLCIYENGYLGVARGRSIGHGSVPVLARDLPYKPLAKIRKPPAILKKSELSMEDDAYANGFAIVTLSATAGQATADYYQCLKGTAQLLASETLN